MSSSLPVKFPRELRFYELQNLTAAKAAIQLRKFDISCAGAHSSHYAATFLPCQILTRAAKVCFLEKFLVYYL